MTAHIPVAAPRGVAAVPPSKSLAHRLLIGAALAEGVSHIGPVEVSEDIAATAGALRQLGAGITFGDDGTAVVEGIANGASPRAKAAAHRQYLNGSIIVDCGASASTLRFLVPVFSVLRGEAVFIGHPRLFARPMDVYRDIFAAQFRGFIPTEDSVLVSGYLTHGTFHLPGNVSSQFISGLLWALPLLEADSRIVIQPPLESQSYVALTRTVQARYGVHSRWEGPHTLVVPGGQPYCAGNHAVEGDWSQGALLCVLAALWGDVTIAGLAPDSQQGDRVILDILRRCGVAHHFAADGHLHLHQPDGPLQAAGDIDLADCPDLGPALCVLAAFCRGETRLLNAGRLRGKESDRLAAMAEELGKLGVGITAGADSMAIVGGTALRGGQKLCAHGDHRVAMALAVAVLCGQADATIDGAEAVNKSWPGFWETLRTLGVPVALEKSGAAPLEI